MVTTLLLHITTCHYYIVFFITSHCEELQWIVMKPFLPITHPPNLEMVKERTAAALAWHEGH